jgi:pyruvate/2-oxoglutarate/acetoin dehydrogenase E1 component
VARVSSIDTPPPFAPVMEAYYLPSADKIVAAVHTLMGERQNPAAR